MRYTRSPSLSPWAVAVSLSVAASAVTAVPAALLRAPTTTSPSRSTFKEFVRLSVPRKWPSCGQTIAIASTQSSRWMERLPVWRACTSTPRVPVIVVRGESLLIVTKTSEYTSRYASAKALATNTAYASARAFECRSSPDTCAVMSTVVAVIVTPSPIDTPRSA